MNAAPENKGDLDDGPVQESVVVHTRESHTAPVRRLRERIRLPLMVGVPLVVGVVGLYFYLTGGRYESTDDAYLRAAQVSISPNVSGRVIEVDVHDNQSVRRGETLIRLDDRPFRIAVEDARARVANARLQVESLKATYWQRMADLRSAKARSRIRRASTSVRRGCSRVVFPPGRRSRGLWMHAIRRSRTWSPINSKSIRRSQVWVETRRSP